jgi:gas vesicle protein GvpL/GvpF
VPKRTATYVYCVIASSSRPSLAHVPAGLPATRPTRLLELEPGRYLVVADAPLSRYGHAAIQRGLSNLEWISRAAVAHERVVEAFKSASAVLPMKLFTLFSSDERAIAHLQGERRRIESLVKRLADHDEWGVRLLLDRAVPAARSRAPRSRASRNTGLSYLTEKKARRDAERERAERAGEVVADLYDRLSERSRAARRVPADTLPMKGGPLLLDAAFLVPRPRSRAFTAMVRRERRALARRGYQLTLTGPWPPYSFIDD